MKRSLVMRRIATAVLVSFAGLLLLAIASMVFGDAVRRGTSVFLAHTETFEIDRPIRLMAVPNIVLKAGTIKYVRSPESPQHNIDLHAAIIEILLGSEVGALEAGQGEADVAGSKAMADTVAALSTVLETSELSKVRLQNGTLVFKWSGGGRSVLLSDVDAEVLRKGRSGHVARGHFVHLGQTVAFTAASQAAAERPDVDGGGVAAKDKLTPFAAAVAERQISGGAWPFQIELRSALLDVRFDGALSFGESWEMKGQAEVKTPDTTKLAAWLGYGWRNAVAGPAFLIKGLAHWKHGAIAFGKSQISLGDQLGVGALSLGYRDARPLVEATVAFAALDVAPLLLGPAEPEPSALSQVTALLPLLPKPASARPTWRSLATFYPSTARIDADLRLSARTLQWRGEPVGKGAFGVSARNGVVHGDFAELDLGPYAGNLQIGIDGPNPGAPVTLRGRFAADNLASVGREFFGTNIVSGSASSQFEMFGRGATLGEVVDGASGRGSLSARDGEIHLDLAAMQRLIATPSQSGQLGGWGAISAAWAYQTLGLKFLLRDGAVVIDDGRLQSNGLVAVVNGRVGLSTNDVDLQVRVEPSNSERATARPLAFKPNEAAARVGVPYSGEVLAIHGPWAVPSLSVASRGALP